MPTTLPTTANPAWGFFGTLGDHAEAAWPAAVVEVARVTGCDPAAVALFLDSRHGRHFADDVLNALATGAAVPAAVQAAAARWMAWRIGRATSRQHGIPAGMPYLTGWVMAVTIADEAA